MATEPITARLRPVAGDLDDAPPGEREAHVRGVLARTVSAAGYLDVAQEAVAAAALIAAQCPGGRPVATPTPTSLSGVP